MTDHEELPEELHVELERSEILRYGENPHQSAALYKNPLDPDRPGIATGKKIQGKELSYNNLLDADAAFECVAEFDEPAIVIVKHTNPCGVALGENLYDAYLKALACDPVSAFGGIVAANSKLTAALASELVKIFLEVVIAPSAEDEALAILASKPNVRVVLTGSMPDPRKKRLTARTIAGGFLVQSADGTTFEQTKTVTKREPTPEELADLIFAFTLVKHVKSNAIVYAKKGQTVGVGAGQMSRVYSAKIAAIKAADANLSLKGSVMASDAFFPFRDSVDAAHEAGVTAIIQPGGSVKDQDSIDAANEHGMAMVFTGVRHFRH
ncbi:MAG: bifunctional phosphoribosylaminoimidazolecarboxamide formyltransferase/IMP cyclohydrolase [Candidatus Kaiserbacteria bacterium]|nr:MAG: bifunctional phosphoribosylaminoimidazolecarboxamide formyltransferase/IMP cyclohydrolase [Candidatus Kaiserbacteria bacterium]